MTRIRESVSAGGMAYAVVGSGEPMLWLSGYLVPYRALEPYVARFADRYTCVVLDARGTGLTPSTWLPRTTASMAIDALAVLREAGFESAHVHGISLGGMVAQELAIRAPHRVRALILGATTAGGFSTLPADLGTMWSNRPRTSEWIPGIGRVQWRGAVNQAWAASRHDAASRLARVQSPALVLHGTHDTHLPVENSKTLTRLLPRADMRLLNGAGHFYPFQAPKESAEAVLDWLVSQVEIAPGRRPDQVRMLGDVIATPARALRSEILPWWHAYRACGRG